MNRLVQATASTPLGFRAGRDSRHEDTLAYVPGSALLGGLAAEHARAFPEQAEEFAAFFLSGKVRFGNLYPAAFDAPATPPGLSLDHSGTPVRPLPLTARSCKRFGGFRYAPAADEERHGVWDTLRAWAAFALSEEQDPSALLKLKDCPECRQPLDSFAGFCRRGASPEAWGRARDKKGFFTRTGISRERGAVASGMLYTREFLPAGTPFCGECQVRGGVPDALVNFLKSAPEGMLRVGHNRTRGLGKLAIPEATPLAPDTPDVIRARAVRFDAALREVAGAHARHAFYLPLTLTADCIWPDGAGRYRLRISEAALAQAWGIAGAHLIYCCAATRRVSAWNGLWGLPKSDAWAISMGSVFLYALEAEPDWQALADGQEEGLGVRRPEGFGAVRVADEFHWEVTRA